LLTLLTLGSASAQTYTWETYNPPVVSWGPNRIDFFQIGRDGHLWHTSFNGVAWQTAWDDRGGPEAGTLPGLLSVVSWGPNRLDIFMGGGDYRHLWHTAWNGSHWQPWDDQGTPNTVYSFGVLSAVSWGPNRLDVFTVGDNGHLWQLTWNGSSWVPWTDRGAPAGASLIFTSAVSWGPNRIDVFATSGASGSGTVWHTAWNGSSWQGWDSRGAPPNSAIGLPVALSWGPGRLDVFTYSSGQCWHDSWNGSSWEAAWDDRGAPPPSLAWLSDELRAVSWGSNRLDVFGLANTPTGDADVWHMAWDGSSWEQWEGLGSPPPGAGALWVSSWGTERLDVFTETLGHIWQLTWNGSTWLPWTDRGAPPPNTI
jgi:hypothetical protein